VAERRSAAPVHGGDIAGAVERHGGEALAYLDFSANINPLGPPRAVLAFLREHSADVGMLARYPDPAYRSLRAAIATHEGISTDSIVVANGSAALFDAVLRALRPASCLLPLPAFSEYGRALQAAGVTTIPFTLDAESDFKLDAARFAVALEHHRPGICIINNPHNPSGSLLHADAFRALVQRAQALDVTVLADEAFIDYIPDHTLTRDILTSPKLIVTRSLTKFYAMPALRVGYAAAAPGIAASIAAQLPSWPITTHAAEAAVCALTDSAYAHRTRALNASRRANLSRSLAELGFRLFPSSANYVLMSGAYQSARVASRLASEHRILIRDCDSYTELRGAGYLRVAIRDEADNGHLLRALAAIAAEK
jgi:threonine-phosphate decarboxylase